MRGFEEYRERYRYAHLSREDGVLEVELHTDGGSLVWGDGPHSELGYLFADIGADPDNRVVILTGAGEAFCERLDDSWVGEMNPEKWQKIFFHGHRLLLNLLDIEVPVIAVVNGPARIHAELALLSDIVIGTPTAILQDAPHFRFGAAPTDGVHVIWQELLGPNRGRSFLLLGDRIAPDDAERLGLYHHVEPDALAAMASARAIAAELAAKPSTVLRYTRFALTRRFRELLAAGLSYGLAIEGLGAFQEWPTE
ncbi:MAG TPA: enoyl-CoA hydratase/isomerase family protein [Pseudolysinimonas sp.]|jgi:enoyl-CoA hydratase/carnithine racemase